MTSNTLQYLADPKPANFADCGFQPGRKFQVAKVDPTDLHSAWFVVMPGGSMLTFNNCADDAMDEAAANWVAGALNAAMLATPPAQPVAPVVKAQAGGEALSKAAFTAWAETEYRNADEYTRHDYDMGLAAWQAALRTEGSQQ